MFENIRTQTKGKKAALIVLLSLVHEVKNMAKEELEAEIREAIEESLARIPWVAFENLIIVEE